MFKKMDRSKKYFLEKLIFFSNIKVDAKFDCGSNARTLRLRKSLPEPPDTNGNFFFTISGKHWDLSNQLSASTLKGRICLSADKLLVRIAGIVVNLVQMSSKWSKYTLEMLLTYSECTHNMHRTHPWRYKICLQDNFGSDLGVQIRSEYFSLGYFWLRNFSYTMFNWYEI